MFNWYEIEVEEKIAQERYRVITDRTFQEMQSADTSPPPAVLLLAWTGRRLTRLGCSLQSLAGQACV